MPPEPTSLTYLGLSIDLDRSETLGRVHASGPRGGMSRIFDSNGAHVTSSDIIDLRRSYISQFGADPDRLTLPPPAYSVVRSWVAVLEAASVSRLAISPDPDRGARWIPSNSPQQIDQPIDWARAAIIDDTAITTEEVQEATPDPSFQEQEWCDDDYHSPNSGFHSDLESAVPFIRTGGTPNAISLASCVDFHDGMYRVGASIRIPKTVFTFAEGLPAQPTPEQRIQILKRMRRALYSYAVKILKDSFEDEKSAWPEVWHREVPTEPTATIAQAPRETFIAPATGEQEIPF